jgi:ligand-binding SRPBCC domain-containing protein
MHAACRQFGADAYPRPHGDRSDVGMTEQQTASHTSGLEHTVLAELRLPRPRGEVFAFFADAGNLERITPPDLQFRIVERPDAISKNCLVDYRLRLDGIPFRWRSRISLWTPDESFIDEQLRGPYRQWIHRHDFESTPDGGTIIRDRVDVVLPFAPLGEIAWPYVKRKLRRIFEFRQRTVAAAFNVNASDAIWSVRIDEG